MLPSTMTSTRNSQFAILYQDGDREINQDNGVGVTSYRRAAEAAYAHAQSDLSVLYRLETPCRRTTPKPGAGS